jgi:hypothetical protein
MDLTTLQKTQLLNLDKMNFIEFWNEVTNATDTHGNTLSKFSVSEALHKKFIFNQRDLLLKSEPNFQALIELRTKTNKPSIDFKNRLEINKQTKEYIFKTHTKGELRRYEYTAEMIENIDISKIGVDANNDAITIAEGDFNDLNDKLTQFLEDRKKNFINGNDKE